MNTIIEKLRALIKMQIRREELNFASLGGGGQTMNIGALEWVLKQLDTLQEQPVCEDVEMELKETELEYQQRSERGEYPASIESIARHFYELGRQSKPKVSEGLEEEIYRWWGEEYIKNSEGLPILPIVQGIARHFAQWGAEHFRDTTKMMETPNDLEEAAVEYSAIGYSPFDDPYEKNQQFECSKFAFIAGAKWQKEQMMKDCVHEVNQAYFRGIDVGKARQKDLMMKEAVSAKALTSYPTDPGNDIFRFDEKRKMMGKFKAGDKVKLIIVKEEENGQSD